MPFPMTHLYIAEKLLKASLKITNPSAFLLGSIAPDSVHFRPNYNDAMKKISHLCVGDEKWGLVTNNSEWSINVLKFLALNKQSKNIDFILGYCSHILADIRNNIVIWTPFRIQHCDELDKGMGSQYHKEAAEVDYEIYRTLNERDAIWELLKQSRSVNINGLVNADDINRMKFHILYEQYATQETSDLSVNKYVTLERSIIFITNELQYIEEQLFIPCVQYHPGL